MFYRAKQMLEKARQSKHGHPTILSRWFEQEGYQKSLAEHNVGEKEVMLFDRIAFERHDFSATRAERLQNAKHYADGHQKPLRQRPEFAAALRQCFKMQDAHLAETQPSLRPIRPEHQQRQGIDQQFEGGENIDYHVNLKTGWRYHRGPRGNPSAASSSSTSQWPTSQWQTSWSSWYSTSSDKWWLLRFPGRNSRKSTGSVDRTPTHKNTSVQYSLITARTAHSMRLAGLEARLKFKTRRDLRASLCAKITLVIWCVTCLIHGCSLTRLAALTLLHVLYLPQNENTQNIPHISELTQSTSCAFKNHSGVKTCRVAETRAQQLPQNQGAAQERPTV